MVALDVRYFDSDINSIKIAFDRYPKRIIK